MNEFDFAVKGTITHRSAPRRWKGGAKRCTLGKSCRATCINRNLVCQVELNGEVSKVLNKIRKISKPSNIIAHPELEKDFNQKNIKKAIEGLKALDKDAPRRVAVLEKLLDRTKTIFFNWKDEAKNKEMFINAVKGRYKGEISPEGLYLKHVKGKVWGGIAFQHGTTIVKASPGFAPILKQIRTKINAQLTDLSRGKPLHYSIGKGTSGSGNNPLVTLIHELGHHAHAGTRYELLPYGARPISTYGETNHKERYAELFTAYIVSGPKLKQLYPFEYQTVESILTKTNLL